ncbi:Uncharacterised protein [Shigella sonnei]|nr:Uncharacterised protein [Shigella sonnei]
MQLVVVEFQQQIEGETLQLFTLSQRYLFHVFLIFIAYVVTVDCFITDNQTDQVCGIGQLSAAGKIHRQPETGIEQKRFKKHTGDFLFQRIITAIMLLNNLSFSLQRCVFFTPGVGGIDIFGLAQRRENRTVRAGMNRFHKADIR